MEEKIYSKINEFLMNFRLLLILVCIIFYFTVPRKYIYKCIYIKMNEKWLPVNQ